MAFPLCDLTGRPEAAALTWQLMKSALCEEHLALPRAGLWGRGPRPTRVLGHGSRCRPARVTPFRQQLALLQHSPPFSFSICLFIPSLFSAIVLNGNSISAEVTLQESYSTEGFL